MKFLKMAVAVDQHNRLKTLLVLPPPPPPPRCIRLVELDQTNHVSLNHQQAMELINVNRSISTPCLSASSPLSYNNNKEANIIAGQGIEVIGGHHDPKSRLLITKVALALQSGADPLPAASGLTGAYLLPSQVGSSMSSIVAVIKPIEEPPMEDLGSPKGFSGQMLGQPGRRPSIRLGETGARELAAYLLDHDGFSGVPPTALLRISSDAFPSSIGKMKPYSGYKMTSVQCFVEHESDAADLGPSCFSVESIHRIGVLDIRVLNLDRHTGNMLLIEGKELIPIDHGLCLPERLDDPYLEWLHWPQALVPFSESEVEYIMSLDPMKDAEIIRNEVPSIRESSVRVLVLCTVFLKGAVVAGLSLARIGEMMTREYHGGEEEESTFSLLENLCMSTKAKMNTKELKDDDEEDEEEEETREDSVSFGELSEEKWLLFLEVFEKLLPNFFEARKEGNYYCNYCC
ncbi:phosphatidylinositol 4-kinase gamma 1-like [Impatiens glandulifera]|uniref:phosphatidylinositol 4-kinase gamma 1-like n=1 Tax=Impatiens glandulifera TaxID=253017 RepID=UPI001FB1643A|nr:phosphatidylinositol 4-kinase gamma 1-like [Impatiens glandulifera]XP_047315243.1 phosphatidylinositol 4-kinase gamma 1-like [Impatiens glandulifera]